MVYIGGYYNQPIAPITIHRSRLILTSIHPGQRDILQKARGVERCGNDSGGFGQRRPGSGHGATTLLMRLTNCSELQGGEPR